MLITTNPKRYLLSTAWLADVGEPWVTYVIRGPVGDRNVRHAVFDGGVAVDFAIVSSLETRWGGLLLRFLTRVPGALRLLPRGLAVQIDSWFASLRKGSPRVLLDKDGAAARLADVRPSKAEHPRPTEQDFAEVVNGFWCLSIWQSKQALRGELWMANNVCDPQMKELLLRMLEWHARATHGWDYETWYTGRFVDRWADPRAAAALRETFARYDVEDVWRALFCTMELFGWLARETAERMSFSYPTAAEEQVTEWVQARFSKRPTARRQA